MNINKKVTKEIIGVDVGGTKIAVGLVLPDGSINDSMIFETDVSSSKATLDSIANAVKEFINFSNIRIDDDEVIGFGIPGLVDSENGIGIASVNLNWKNIPVRSELMSRLKLNCVIENDVRVGAIGEAIYGLAKEAKNFLYLNVGTGVSVVIMIEGNIYSGVNGLAGEIGHAVMLPGGPTCKCGGEGCLEAIVSGPAIAQWAQKKFDDKQTKLETMNQISDPKNMTSELVFKSAEDGDGFAIETIHEIGDVMAYALQYLALAYDPEMIVIGGGVVQGGDIFTNYVQHKLEYLATKSWVFGKIYKPGLVKISSLGPNAGILGAAALVTSRNDRKEKIFEKDDYFSANSEKDVQVWKY